MNEARKTPWRILVVDDEWVVRTLVSRLLGTGERELILASGALEGREKIKGEPFDLLITDLRLPDGHGTEVIRSFKEKFPSAPVVVITGSLTPEDTLASVGQYGIRDCIHKPFEAQTLRTTVTQALESSNDA